jgi:hypothetical protein
MEQRMEQNMLPYNRWQPLSVASVQSLFHNAPFRWGLAGGYAVEQFLGTSIRSHGDIDIIIFRDDQAELQEWLTDWCLYAADPPGTLRVWNAPEWLAYGIHDIWCHQSNSLAWQLQIMLIETEIEEWVSRRHPLIRGPRDALLVEYNQVPCIRIEVQLLYKAKGKREKDTQDFQACLPKLTWEAKAWLKQALLLAHPEGHPWQALLG